MGRDADEICVEMNRGQRTAESWMKDKKHKIVCPICKKTIALDDNLFRPFCSARCRSIDLGKWVSEDYRIPGEKKDIPDRPANEDISGDE
jgi:endogenous inhibitor of DNA gyrase (YacG/DUF329 family)